MVDNFEEFLAVERWQARVWQRLFPKHMISEKYFMVQAMPKGGVGRVLIRSARALIFTLKSPRPPSSGFL